MTAKKGSGQVSILALSVPESSLPFWHDRLHDHGFETTETERFGEKRIAFQHPCGIDYELVGVADDDTAETLSQRILGVEHRIYPEALRLLAEGKVRLEGDICKVSDSAASGTLISPAVK